MQGKRRTLIGLCAGSFGLGWFGMHRTARATPRMSGFDPDLHGFKFENRFENDFIREFNVRTSGLCGGMVYAALDYFSKRRPVPAQDYRPQCKRRFTTTSIGGRSHRSEKTSTNGSS